MKPIAKDTGSGNDGCPSVYIEGDEFVVQGPELDSLADLENVLPGETAVRIGINVVREALARHDAGLIPAGER